MRYFTLEEATEALVTIRPLAERMVELSASVRSSRAEFEEVRNRVAANGHGRVLAAQLRSLEGQLTAGMDALRAIVEEIQVLGAQVKDAGAGLVDFPSRREDEAVLLCWRVGEGEIGFWHGFEEGFGGRKPL